MNILVREGGGKEGEGRGEWERETNKEAVLTKYMWILFSKKMQTNLGIFYTKLLYQYCLDCL